jgi:hypothetical protein
MQTQTLVRASADIVTVHTLRPGDVYKRLTKNWQGQYDAAFGIVQTVDHNGSEAMISSLEVSSTKVEHVVFGTDTDLQIFASTPEEISHGFDQYADHVERTHAAAVEAEAKARLAMQRFAEIRAAVTEGAVQRPQTIVRAAATEEITA